MSREARPHGGRTQSDVRTGPSRRQLLEGTAGVASVATAGCVGWVGAAFDDDSPEHVSLTIKTLPADTDRQAIHIARFLADCLADVGIDVGILPVSKEELRRDVLLNHDFDVYVGRWPGRVDPDFLRTMLHSGFGPEAGWQNPFGYADLDMDDLLAVQRRQDQVRRTTTLWNIQTSIVNNQPFSVVAFPTDHRVCRIDRFSEWDKNGVDTARGYLSLKPTDRDGTDDTAIGSETGEEIHIPADERTETSTSQRGNASSVAERAERGEVRMATTDSRMTRNLNPLAAEYRHDDDVTGLLYDPLGRVIEGSVRPWLASDWWWESAEHGPLSARVRLRDGVTWHDGTPITADDVVFTYRFLADTSLGDLETPTPATRFRGRSSLVNHVRAVDDQMVEFSFGGNTDRVSQHAFTVPVLPAHIWASRTGPADPRWLSENVSATEALVSPNTQPVGSGPFQFSDRTAGVNLTLVSYEEHFLNGEIRDSHLEPYNSTSVDQLRFEVVPSTRMAVSLTLDGSVDGTASAVRPSEVPSTLLSTITCIKERPTGFYHVGFNVRRSPLSNPRFRRAVARLLDKEYLVEVAFEGHAQPASSPLARHDEMATRLRWDDRDPELPFPGEDGDLNPARARGHFRRAGYRYGEDGELLVR